MSASNAPSNATEQCSATMQRGIGTDVRTYGLTESIQPSVAILTFRNARTHMPDFESCRSEAIATHDQPEEIA